MSSRHLTFWPKWTFDIQDDEYCRFFSPDGGQYPAYVEGGRPGDELFKAVNGSARYNDWPAPEEGWSSEVLDEYRGKVGTGEVLRISSPSGEVFTFLFNGPLPEDISLLNDQLNGHNRIEDEDYEELHGQLGSFSRRLPKTHGGGAEGSDQRLHRMQGTQGVEQLGPEAGRSFRRVRE